MEEGNFPKYEDEIDLFKTYDISAYVTSIKKGIFFNRTAQSGI